MKQHVLQDYLAVQLRLIQCKSVEDTTVEPSAVQCISSAAHPVPAVWARCGLQVGAAKRGSWIRLLMGHPSQAALCWADFALGATLFRDRKWSLAGWAAGPATLLHGPSLRYMATGPWIVYYIQRMDFVTRKKQPAILVSLASRATLELSCSGRCSL
jgi:hypothetical protein